jgi:hypothetical protein
MRRGSAYGAEAIHFQRFFLLRNVHGISPFSLPARAMGVAYCFFSVTKACMSRSGSYATSLSGKSEMIRRM